MQEKDFTEKVLGPLNVQFAMQRGIVYVHAPVFMGPGKKHRLRLALAEEKYRSLVERLPDIVLTTTRGRWLFVTNNVERLTGFTPTELRSRGALACGSSESTRAGPARVGPPAGGGGPPVVTGPPAPAGRW